MIKVQPKSVYFDGNLSKSVYAGTPAETDKPDRAGKSNEERKAEIKQKLHGEDTRPSYTKQQLLKMGFKEDYVSGTYFDQSSYNIADKNITLKMKKGLSADGKEITTINELLDALNNGLEVTAPSSPNKSIVPEQSTPREANKPASVNESSEVKKAKFRELGYGNDIRISYTAEQLQEIGFNDSNANYGAYFEASSENLLDKRAGTVTYKIRLGLTADGKEIKTVYELLEALNNGIEITIPNRKNPPISTSIYRR